MKIVAKNRRATFDFEILETFEVGIQLTGQEVKACRMNLADLSGAYVSFTHATPVLKKMTIRPYPFASNALLQDPSRDRILLLHTKEIDQLKRATDEKGMSVIPLEVKAGKYIKVVLGLGRGRKQYDKREKIKEREAKKRSKMQGE